MANAETSEREYSGLLSAYDPEVAVRVRTEEKLEDVVQKLSLKGMKPLGIAEVTGVSIERILEISKNVLVRGA